MLHILPPPTLILVKSGHESGDGFGLGFGFAFGFGVGDARSLLAASDGECVQTKKAAAVSTSTSRNIVAFMVRSIPQPEIVNPLRPYITVEIGKLAKFW